MAAICEICKQPRVARTSKVNSEISSRRISWAFDMLIYMMSRAYSEKNQIYNIFFPLFTNIFTNAPGLESNSEVISE